MSFRWTSMSLQRVTFREDLDHAVSVLVFGAGGGGGGASSFLQLTDTPAAYTGQAGRLVAVNGTANGLEFIEPAAGGAPAWGSITGTLSAQADLQAALDGKSNTGHGHPAGDITGLAAVATSGAYTDLSGRPVLGTAAFVNISAFEAAGAVASGVSAHAAATSGVHGITAFGATVVAAADAAAARGLLGAAATAHTHPASDIVSGTLAVNRGGTGSTGFITPSNYSPGSATVSAHLAAIDTALGDRAAASHGHGNITNNGAIGSTANLPVITGASGVLVAGAFGTAANTFCEGNDSRLSDARTPLAHNQDAGTITTGTLDRARLPTLRQAKTVVIPEPVVGDRFGGFTRRALTLQQLSAVLVGSSSPSVGWTLRYAADRSAAGTAVVTAGTTTTTTTTAQTVSSFDNAVIPANHHWWLEIASVSGTVDQIEVTLDAEEAA